MNPDPVQPLYLFSLPRAGSTLVQRILGCSPQIYTVAEPWLLLPYLYTLRKGGFTAEYDAANQVVAFEDFWTHLPNGKADHLQALADMVMRLYQLATPPGVRYFLDKTPRYHVIAHDIMELLPKAKAIFLWRNPLAVAASRVETWHMGSWRMHAHHHDLIKGLECLIAAYQQHPDRALAVQYEQLLTDPQTQWKRVFDHLELPWDPEYLKSFDKVKLDGRMGDPTGRLRYRQVSTAPLEKWKASITNSVRRQWCLRYLNWLGRDRMAVMGYDLDAMVREVESIPLSGKHWWGDRKRVRRHGWPPYRK